MRLKTFKIKNLSRKYRAEDLVFGLLVNPHLPSHFYDADIADRSDGELAKWFNVPFVLGSDERGWRLLCLNDGAWDRPSEYGYFAEFSDAVRCAVEERLLVSTSRAGA
jgi:hypothetical protein